MTEHRIEDFHGDGVFRDESGTIWVPLQDKIDGMARAWDEGHSAGEQNAGNGFASLLTGLDAPEPIQNPYRAAPVTEEGDKE